MSDGEDRVSESPSEAVGAGGARADEVKKKGGPSADKKPNVFARIALFLRPGVAEPVAYTRRPQPTTAML